jgi:hypothetical protein
MSDTTMNHSKHQPELHPEHDRVTPLVSHCAIVMGLARRLGRMGRRLWLLPLAICSLIIFDAWLPLPVWTRSLVAVLLLLWIVWVVIQLVPFLGPRTAPLHAARTLEERLDLRSNIIVNAMQLRSLLTSDDRFAATLAARAVEDAHRVLPDAPLYSVVDRRSILRPWLLVLAAAAVLLTSAAIAPRVFAAVTPRFVFPLGDHPPFSPTMFRIKTDPERVLVGDDVTLRVALDGEIPAQLALILDIPEREQELRLRPVDDATPPRQYEAQLRSVTAPVDVYVTGPTGRSRTLHIEPIPEPRILAATLTVTPPTYTGLTPRTFELDLGKNDQTPVDVLLGSTAELRVRTTLTLQSATTSTPGALSDVIDTVARATLSCTTDGRTDLTLHPIGPTGLKAAEPFSTPLQVFADAPPQVVLTEPDADRVALTHETVPLRALAEDDVALAHMDITWTLRDPGGNVRTQQTLASPQQGSPEPFGEAAHILQPHTLGAEPGDVLEIVARATDVAMSTVVTPTMTVRIIDDDTLQQMRAGTLDIESLTEPYEDLAAGLRALAAATESHDASSDDMRTAILQQAQEILDTPPAVDFEADARDAVERVVRQMEAMDESGEQDAATQARTAAQDGEATLERPAEQLRLADALQQLAEALAHVTTSQRALATDLQGDGALPLARDRQHVLLERLREIVAGFRELGERGTQPAAPEELAALVESMREQRKAIVDMLTTKQPDDAARRASDLALTDLYFTTDPIADAVREYTRTGAPAHCAAIREHVPTALDVIGQIAELMASEPLAAGRIDALRSTVEALDTRATPMLPVMGQSALDLAQRIDDCGAEASMADTTTALDRAAWTDAQALADQAASQLESLMEAGDGSGESGEASFDQPLALSGAPNASTSQGSDDAPATLPNALEQLSLNRQTGGTEAPGNDGPQEMVEQGEPTPASGQQPGVSEVGDRATQGSNDIPDGPPPSVQRLRQALVESGISTTEAESIALSRIPDAYRDLVAAYLTAVARDEDVWRRGTAGDNP